MRGEAVSHLCRLATASEMCQGAESLKQQPQPRGRLPDHWWRCQRVPPWKAAVRRPFPQCKRRQASDTSILSSSARRATLVRPPANSA
eukprot:scaffold176162_cov30-Tisochrysis_lutea.AAC.2